MTNQLRRELLRQNNIDIEITVVGIGDGNGKWKRTGEYRYIVSVWDDSDLLKKNIYSDNMYNSYNDAENAAIQIGNSELLNKLIKD